MKIRLNKAHFPVTTLGCGRRLGIWVQGCSIGCKGCLSRDTWDARGGWEADVEEILAWCDSRRREVDGITISGGEPFEQPRALKRLLEALDEWRRQLERPFDAMCYSGLPLRRIRQRHADILALLDVLVPEPYIDRRAGAGSPAPGPWRGSSNQPLVPLTRLGRERYGDEERHSGDSPRLQVSLEHGSAWFIGIPGPGDMDRLAEQARARGVALEDVSWRA